MKLKLENPQAILDALKELEAAYNAYQPALTHTVLHIEQQLDAIAEMKKDVADTLDGGRNDAR